jgi:hypothetical protein
MASISRSSTNGEGKKLFEDIHDIRVKEIIIGDTVLEVAWTILWWLEMVAAGDEGIEFCVLKRIAGTQWGEGHKPHPLGERTIEGGDEFCAWEHEKLFWDAFRSIRDLPVAENLKRIAVGFVDGRKFVKWIRPPGYYEWLDEADGSPRPIRPSRKPSRKPSRTLQPA